MEVLVKNAFAILLIFLPILFIFIPKAYPTRSVETVELDSTVDTNLGENACKVDTAILQSFYTLHNHKSN